MDNDIRSYGIIISSRLPHGMVNRPSQPFGFHKIKFKTVLIIKN